MSKRTPTARQGAAPAEGTRRHRLGFNNVRIRSKLALILLVPLVAITVLSAVELARNARTVQSVQRVRSLAEVSAATAAIGQDLQIERSAAVADLGDLAHGSSKFDDAVKATEADVEKYQAKRATLAAVPDAVRGPLDNVDGALKDLDRLRHDVRSGKNTTIAATIFQYRVPIADIIDFRDSLSHLVTDPGLGDQLRASVALSQAKEYVAQEQAVILRALALQGYQPAQEQNFTSTVTGYQNALQTFNRSAPRDLQLTFGKTVTGAKVATASKLETQVSSTPASTALNIPADQWYDSMKGRIGRLRHVEQLADAGVQSTAADRSASLIRQLFVESALILLALVLALMFALVIARSMARSLRRLREGALRVAYEGLPQAVSQLRETEDVGGLDPEQIANQVRDPVQVRGRDEIGQVSEAFNVVHREAVRVAAEQAVLRASVATMFVNLARRSQLLVDRLIGHLDRLEQGEEDPDRLAQLFQLDHLATRMRRNDENLLVLAGSDSTRARREAAPLGDVLRAAQSEVEQYTRIEFGVVDRDVDVEAAAVNDVVHLVAELLDNATTYSSPETPVVVDARRVGDRAIVEIEDRGIGLSPEVLAEFNERLANPPLVDVAVSRMMGLVVVGRLASRLGIKVELRRASDRGTVADVILPDSVLVSRGRAQRQPSELPTPSAPLALETRPDEPPRADVPAADPVPGAPGVPFQPAARGSLADAATAHGHLNGGGSLPRRSPTPPPPVDPTPEPVEQPRRSLFDPPPKRPTPAEPPSADPAASPDRVESGGTDRTAGGLPRRQIADALSGRSSDNGRGAEPPRPDTDRPEPGRLRPPARTDAGMNDLTVETPRITPQGEQPTRRQPVVGFRQGATGSQGDVPGTRQLDSAAPGSSADAGSGRTEIIPRNVDDTMELPIFREVESAWFRTSPSRPRTGPVVGKPPAPLAGSSSAPADRRPPGGPGMSRRSASGRSTGEPERSGMPPSRQTGDSGARAGAGSTPSTPSGPTAARASEVPSEGRPDIDPWRSAADKGWQAASAVSQADGAAEETTKAGLPKRRPMAQLVPGGVEDTGRSTKGRERSPEAVRGLLSAYHRGVQRGRAGGGAPQATSASGHRSTDRGAGEEREA